MARDETEKKYLYANVEWETVGMQWHTILSYCPLFHFTFLCTTHFIYRTSKLIDMYPWSVTVTWNESFLNKLGGGRGDENKEMEITRVNLRFLLIVKNKYKTLTE